MLQKKRRGGGGGGGSKKCGTTGTGSRNIGEVGADEVAGDEQVGNECDAAKVPPLPWTKEEIRRLKALVAAEGVGAWQHKAAQLELLANEVAPGLVLSWLVINLVYPWWLRGGHCSITGDHW